MMHGTTNINFTRRLGNLWYEELKLVLNILIIKPTRWTSSQIYFGKQLYMFRTDLLSIIKKS